MYREARECAPERGGREGRPSSAASRLLLLVCLLLLRLRLLLHRLLLCERLLLLHVPDHHLLRLHGLHGLHLSRNLSGIHLSLRLHVLALSHGRIAALILILFLIVLAVFVVLGLLALASLLLKQRANITEKAQSAFSHNAPHPPFCCLRVQPIFL